MVQDEYIIVVVAMRSMVDKRPQIQKRIDDALDFFKHVGYADQIKTTTKEITQAEAEKLGFKEK